MKFYLGTHETSWLGKLDVPLFVSHRRLAKRKTFPRARVGWALDSGGFTELDKRCRWEVTPQQYVTAVRRYSEEVGLLEWAAPQDWMCEDHILARTGYDVFTHRLLTVTNYIDLRSLAPDLPFVPVLQGYTVDDYLRCADMYDALGVDLTAERVVGVGSVCRRQATREIEGLMLALSTLGLQLHGFGVKIEGLTIYGDLLASSDSLAWSATARRQRIRLPGCTHQTCANCDRYALRWRERVLVECGGRQQHLAVVA